MTEAPGPAMTFRVELALVAREANSSKAVPARPAVTRMVAAPAVRLRAPSRSTLAAPAEPTYSSTPPASCVAVRPWKVKAPASGIRLRDAPAVNVSLRRRVPFVMRVLPVKALAPANAQVPGPFFWMDVVLVALFSTMAPATRFSAVFVPVKISVLAPAPVARKAALKTTGLAPGWLAAIEAAPVVPARLTTLLVMRPAADGVAPVSPMMRRPVTFDVPRLMRPVLRLLIERKSVMASAPSLTLTAPSRVEPVPAMRTRPAPVLVRTWSNVVEDATRLPDSVVLPAPARVSVRAAPFSVLLQKLPVKRTVPPALLVIVLLPLPPCTGAVVNEYPKPLRLLNTNVRFSSKANEPKATVRLSTS